MRNKILLALVTAAVLLFWSGGAATNSGAAALTMPQIGLADFKFIVGQWEGQLEYLDYRDGKSRVKLATSLDCKVAGERLEYMFVYTEPNGSKVNGDPSNIKVEAGKVFINEEEWQVLDHSSHSEPRQIVLSRQGKDNDKPATQRRTFSIEYGELRILNEVKPEGAQNYFVRNEMKFKRK